MKIYDLSHTISSDMTVYSKDTIPTITKVADIDNDGYQESLMKIYSHNGTHIDSPKHMVEGSGLDDMDINNFIGQAMIINVEGMLKIELDYIKKYENDLKNIDFLILKSGWSRYWKTKKYFEGYPTLTKEATLYLSKSNLKGLGIDMISVDHYNSNTYENHNILLTYNKIIVENITNLDKVATKFLFSAMPLKYNDADGSPTRAVAIIV